ncbi:hypothetical protein SYNPS1DRAFT_31972 [Syncephalis pseudoplumigaleata]|uniref:Uncharacterized protein n=1 Tax=Syncephalis pseudoplumigaleata TaxID=1712513 RepID=A0A4P9YRR8_9FUNG|nr:hypothetical protein SYNPS1DRAFT_31972 [Syncephalis pseudoplumigaleata]|eukprot:RKP22434.1 hypothetical protein SYNPS1DRAFT_31972 [Syncephalis pseudoplumigaleata]
MSFREDIAGQHIARMASTTAYAPSSTPPSKQKLLTDSESELSLNDHDYDNDSLADVSIHTVQTVLPDVVEEDMDDAKAGGYAYSYQQYTAAVADDDRHYASARVSGHGGHARSLTASVIGTTPTTTTAAAAAAAATSAVVDAAATAPTAADAALPVPREAVQLARSPSSVLHSDAYREAVARFHAAAYGQPSH